jgi:phosphopantetheine--protein transferase-like protein
MASRVFNNLPHDWTYYQDAENRRRLKCAADSPQELFVSISHSGDWIAAAISDAPIGIDIETFSKQRDFIAIATHVFSAAEICFLKSCDAEELKQNFYLHWTLKESVAKQDGAGLKFEMSRIQSPVLVSEGEQASIQSWQCPDYVVALASEVPVKVEIHGLCDNAKHQRWKNIPSGQ